MKTEKTMKNRHSESEKEFNFPSLLYKREFERVAALPHFGRPIDGGVAGVSVYR
jgi:hypothetical protein